METFLFIVICIVWFISGAASLIYWWTKEFDFTWDEFPLIIVSGATGPITFIVAWVVYKIDMKSEKKGGVLFKKRTHLKSEYLKK